MLFHLEMSLPPEGELGPLRRIKNLYASFSAFYFYHIDDSNGTNLHKKREGRYPATILPPQHIKWVKVHCPAEPVALPWEGNLWLSWGQLRAINTGRKSFTPAPRGRSQRLSPQGRF